MFKADKTKNPKIIYILIPDRYFPRGSSDYLIFLLFSHRKKRLKKGHEKNSFVKKEYVIFLFFCLNIIHLFLGTYVKVLLA